MRSRSLWCLCAIFMLIGLQMSSPTYAYLGGFEVADGYASQLDASDPSGTILGVNDVAIYNAGQFGTLVGGGTATRDNSDTTAGPNELWTRLQGAANKNTVRPWSYATGHDRFDRTWVNSGGNIFTGTSGTDGLASDQALVITTNSADAPWDGVSFWTGPPRQYSYRTDQYDFGTFAASGPSVATASPSDSKIEVSFWSCAQIFGINDTHRNQSGGIGPNTVGDTISFYDSNGTLGFEVGYIQPGTNTDNIWYRTGGSGASGVDTGIPNPSADQYYRWDLSIDTLTDTVDIDFNGSNLVSNAPLLANMSDLAELQFTSTAGINNEKLWSLDDFEFCVKEAPLSELLDGGILCSGDKKFSDFEYHGGGDMPAAEDIYVQAITDENGHFGIRFQGAFVDDYTGGASDALIDFKVTAPEGKLIKDVHMSANPVVIGGDQGLVSITETFLPTNDQTVLAVYDIPGGERKLTDWADLEDEDGNLDPVRELHVQKDILVWSQAQGSVGTLSFIDQTFSQCDDLNGDGACDGGGVGDPGNGNDPTIVILAGDFDLDGDVDGSDFLLWQRDPTVGDLADWQANYGAQPSANDGVATVAVPEPSSLGLLFVALVATLRSSAGRQTGKERRE